MGKTYYSDFVAHMTRFYFIWDNTVKFRSPEDEQNYKSVQKVMEELTQLDRETLRRVYVGQKPTSSLRNDGSVYRLLKWYEKRVAQTRGLIASEVSDFGA